LRSRKSNGTALIIASEHNRVEVAIKLIENGAEINTGNSTGRTPLWYAAVNGCVKIVDALLARGASVNSCTDDESTPLVVAAEKGNCEIVKKLVPTAKRTHRQIALYWASASGHVQVVKFLLECGLDVDCSVSGLRPLQIAAQNGHHDVIGALLERHADVNSVDSNNITPLVAATRNGHAQAVRILLDHGADFNIEDSDGMTPLAAACELGHLEVVRHLLVHGAPVESADRRGRRPLWLAASNGHCEVINVLLEHGADLNACDDAGITPMTASALNKHIESTCFILKEGGQQFNISSSAPRIADSVPSSEILSALKCADDTGFTDLGDLENAEDNGVIEVMSSILTRGGSVNCCLNEGNTLLHFAAFSGNVEAALVLLQHGASVNDNGQRADGIGPLAVACIKKHSQLVDVLLEHGADPNAMDAENMTPLMHAVRHQSLDVVDYLIKHGADVNTYVGLECKLPVLYYAAASGNTQIVAALLRSGADCNARVRHVDDGMTSLHVACIGGHLEVVSQLIAAGANVNVKCSAGYTPLWHAIVHGFRDITNVLLNNGSDVNAQPFLHVAIVQGHEDIVRTLLDADADMEVRDNSGWTPLWAAVAADRPDIALLLMERGANVNVKCHYDKYDWTLLMLTLIEPGVNFRRIVFDLLVHGAEVNARSFEDITALMCACYAGDEDIVLALLNCGATLDDVDIRGQTALNWAVSHCSIIQLLLDHGATVDQRPNCVPPLMSAVESGNTASARLLLQCGADVNERFSDGRQPLHVACGSAKSDIVNLLLDHGASINDTALGHGTPLFFAISKQHVHLVSLLLERGANASKPAKDDDSMMTPLKLAVLIGNEETVRLLLHSKSLDQNDIRLALMQVFCSARGNVQVLRLLLESCNEEFVKAALPVAVSTSVRNNDGATLEILLNLSNDVCIADYFSKYCNVIFTAADNGQTDVIRIFIRRGVNTDVRNVDGKSPLIMAAARGHLETVKLLVENDADVFATDDGGKSALQHASYNGHSDVVTYLSHYHRYVRPVDSRHNSSTKQSNPLFEVNDVAEAERLIIQENIDIECENLHGSRPLHFAARRGHVDLVRLLLECGATSDAADFNGHTPLHEAAGHSLNVVEMLLRYTKRINVQNIHGRTPLHEAVQNKRYDIALYLLECGADAGVTDDWMNTALQYAASQDWFSMSPLFDRLSAHSLSAWAKPNVIGISARQRLRLIAECLRAEDKTVVYQRSNRRNADDLHNTELHRIVGAYGASKLFAVCSDPSEAVALLLKSPGADMNVRNIYGQTPLHVCRSYEAVKACLQHGPAAALTATDKRGRNIWHLLAVRGNAQQFVDIIEQLVPDVGNYGLDAVDALGRTPLHYSVTRSVNRYFSRWLVNKVSHCQNVTDWYGRTPSQYYTSLMDQTGAEGTTKEKDMTSIVDDMSFLEKYQLTYFDYFQYNLETITANKFQENHFRVSRNLLLSGFDKVLSCLRESRHQQLSLREADDENWFILELYRKHFYTYTEHSEILEDAPLSPRAQTNDGIIGIGKFDSNSSQMYHGRQMFKSISEIVTQAMSSLIRTIAKIDQRFSGRLVPAGSVFEETKIDFCDEFDFIVELEQFGKMCTVVESPCSPAGFVFISSASHAQNANFAEFFDGNNGLLNTRLVKFRFETLVRRVLSEARFQMENDFLEVIEIIRGESVLYSFYPDRLATNIKMKFMKPVNGQHVFHEVSIDIVPAITIENYWPSNAVQDIVGQLRHFIESVPAPRCFLVFDQPQKKHPWTGWTPPHARVDFSVFESEIIRACPSVVRAACIVVKQIVKNFCNFRFFKSYVIKAALMHSIITSSADNCRSDSASADRSQDVHQLVSWVQRIMRRLLCFALQDFVPSVFLPGFVLPVCSFETHVKFSHVRLHQSGIAYDDVIRSELLLGDNTNKMVDSQFEHIIKAYVGSHLMYWSVLPNAVTRQLFFPPINPVFEEDYWSLMHCETKFPSDSSI
jgi:ankyrin repeat protein